MQNIKLQSSDGEIFDVHIEVAKCSGTIKDMLEDCGIEDSENAVIPLPNVSSKILRKVLEWADYHKDDPFSAEDEIMRPLYIYSYDISSWDKEFLEGDQDTLFELIMAANYLDIKRLLKVTCAVAANMIKGKNPEQIRAVFKIKNDSPAPENQELKETDELPEGI